MEGSRNRALRSLARRGHRQPGGADGQGGPAVHLPVRLAGGGRRQQRGPDVPGPEPVPGRQRPRPDPQDQRRAGAGGPDPPRRGRRLHRLVPSHRRRRGGRLRRRAQCVRADEGHDRRGRGRRALRGPALLGEEVRPHGRQGRPSHPRVGAEADRGAPRGRRVRGPHPARRAHRRARREAAHQRRRPERPRLRHRQAHGGGVLRGQVRDGAGGVARARIRSLRGPGVVRDVEAGSRRGPRVRPGDPRALPGQAARLQLLAVVQLEGEPRRRHGGAVPGLAGGDGLPLPVHHAGRLPRHQLRHVRAGARVPRPGNERLRGASGSGVRGRSAGATPPTSTSGRSAPATSTRSPRRSPAARARFPPSPGRPRRSSSRRRRKSSAKSPDPRLSSDRDGGFDRNRRCR